MILCLLQKSFGSHTKCLAFPRTQISRKPPLLPHEDMWPGLQPSHQLLFASALLLPHKVVLGSFVVLPFLMCFFGDIQGMLLSGVSETLKYAVFSHGCCTGKILENFPQVTYDI